MPVLTPAPPKFLAALDQRDALAEVRGLRRAFFSGGAGADYDQVKGFHVHCPPCSGYAMGTIVVEENMCCARQIVLIAC